MTAWSIRCRVGVAAAAITLAASGAVRAQSPAEIDQSLDTVARVISSSSELRAGPGLSYRVIERAERGETFFVQGREQTGYWLRVYLPDGRTAYLLGDTADTMLATDAGADAPGAPGVFAPPPLSSARTRSRRVRSASPMAVDVKKGDGQGWVGRSISGNSGVSGAVGSCSGGASPGIGRGSTKSSP